MVKDKNGVEIVDKDRVRRGEREGVVIDTGAGAGVHVTLIGVMWDGAEKVEFLASRDVEVVDEQKARDSVALGLMPKGVTLNERSQLHVWLLEPADAGDALTLRGDVPEGVEEVWVKWDAPAGLVLTPSKYHMKIWEC